jgi:hypothetical protein
VPFDYDAFFGFNTDAGTAAELPVSKKGGQARYNGLFDDDADEAAAEYVSTDSERGLRSADSSLRGREQ